MVMIFPKHVKNPSQTVGKPLFIQFLELFWFLFWFGR